MTQNEKINLRLAPLGLTTKDLTKAELSQARAEQRERDKGRMVTDGIFCSRELLSLKRKKR